MQTYKFVLNRKKLVVAPLWRRVVAFLLDQFILSLFYVLVMAFVSPQLIFGMYDDNIFSAVVFPFSLIILFYFSSSEYLFSMTIGKRLMNIRVLYNKPNVSIWRHVARNIAKSIGSYFLLIDCILMPFDQRHRRLSDFLFGSVVFMSD